jgi:hypothetical protein
MQRLLDGQPRRTSVAQISRDDWTIDLTFHPGRPTADDRLTRSRVQADP